MSKLSQLKQDAYQAGKKKDWELAVSIYEQILEIDKTNPMVINEMGDLCLKAGEIPRAVRHFLNAASRYRTTGLLNNAVAIYKKILRYDSENQGAHWYLAETRASQGLLVEGEDHALKFLASSENVSGDIKEIFLKRCGQLFDLYATSRPILDSLLTIFRTWGLKLEVSRTSCLLACFTWDEGDEDGAKKHVEAACANTPEVRNYPEYQRAMKKIDPNAAQAATVTADVNSLDLGSTEPPAASETPAEPTAESGEEPVAETAAEPTVAAQDDSLALDDYGFTKPQDSPESAPETGADETSFSAVADETSFAAVTGDVPAEPSAEPSAETVEEAADDPEPIEIEIDEDENRTEDGCFDLSDEGGASFEDLVAQAASGLGVSDEPETEEFTDEIVVQQADAESAETAEEEPAAETGDVDLLAQILADGDDDASDTGDSQVEAITEDIGAQMSGDGDQDAASLYEMGMVYLDMGLFDQAADSFGQAAADSEYAARSSEMLGITLLRAQRPGEAVEALKTGLGHVEKETKEYLGLQYHLGQAHEQNGQEDEAIALYQEIHRLSPNFLDVEDRLAQLSNV